MRARTLRVKALRHGTGWHGESPCVCVVIDGNAYELTANEARRLVVHVERAIEKCEEPR